jgi:hypothetical protein
MQTQLLITLSEEKRAFFLALLAELDFVEHVQEVLPAEQKAAQEEEEHPFIPARDFSKFPPTPEEVATRPGNFEITPPTPEENETYEAELAELLDEEYPDSPSYKTYENESQEEEEFSKESERFGDKERVAMIKKMNFVPPRDYSKFPPTPEEIAARPGSFSVSPLSDEEKAIYEAEVAELHDSEYPDEDEDIL